METRHRKIILREIAELEQQIARLRKQQEEAEIKLRSLKRRLTQNAREITGPPKHSAEASDYIATKLSPADKVALFIRLFRGREDVYPKLWQNQKTGKKGYSPACANEWVRGVCEKPLMKCGECPNQAFLPVPASYSRHGSGSSPGTSSHRSLSHVEG